MSYQQCTRFGTTLDFDREYLWKGLSNRQAKNGALSNAIFSMFNEKKLGKIWSNNDKKMTWPLTYDLEIQ